MAEQWFDNKPTILETNYTACVLGRTHLKGVTEVPDETADYRHGVVNEATCIDFRVVKIY